MHGLRKPRETEPEEGRVISFSGYCAVYPPSTMISWPVVNAAPGELSQSTTLASSSGRADAANRVLSRNRFLHVGLTLAEGAVEHFGLNCAGRDTVDADTMLGEFQRSRLGETDHCELAGDIHDALESRCGRRRRSY